MVDLTGEPITLAQATANLRGIQPGEEDDVSDMIIAAREWAEDYTGLVLTARTVMQASCDFGLCGLDLYAWPVRSITSISYVDTGGNSQTLDPSSYIASLIQRPVRIVAAFGSVLPALALRPAAVTITCEAGYATPALVPQRVKRAMLMTVNHFYENRSSVLTGQRAAAIEVPQGAKDLLAGLRTWTV